ncbi:MAG: hypothetical protein L0Y67_06375 [Gammaproteobacteria bacterium]|nr:hypothetical protein [Gammaproteobacteria bacterium]
MEISAIATPEQLNVSASNTRSEPVSWRFPPRALALRLFFTCWLVYTLHFATNIVREIYPALAIGDHFSFRVDEYAHMHPDLFEKEGYGWHIGNNPGASMLAAIPYALSRPIIDCIVERVKQGRAASGQTEPTQYNSPWPMAREFYQEAWRRGFDIKFGLAAFVMQSMCMASISALSVVVMFFLLRRIFGSDKTALWLSLLYAFGTPVFFRTGFLNHNLMLGHIAFMGFVTLWNPGGSDRWSTRTRFFLGGVTGGTALLFDYSGAVLLLGLFFYGIAKRVHVASIGDALRHSWWYLLGTLGPVALLWFYQWQSFGHPFYPGQHWMPPVEWSNLGYQGYTWPQLDLLLALVFDYRFGLFVSSPIMLLAVLSPLINHKVRDGVPRLEMVFALSLFVALWVFFSGSNYARLQFNTGIRYMAPIFPFLFVPAAIVLMRLPRFAIYFVAVLSVAESWCLAMYRDVERGLGVLDPILHVLFGGFQLPALTTLSRMGAQYGGFFEHGVSPLPLFVLMAGILYGIWSPRLSSLKKGFLPVPGPS